MVLDGLAHEHHIAGGEPQGVLELVRPEVCLARDDRVH
jgi:hypothetical protein